MKLLLAGVLFLHLITFSSLISIKCVYYGNGDWWVLKKLYYCNVQDQLNIDSPERSEIDSVRGVHFKNMTFDNVEGFEADNLTVHYFPRGLEKFFKNLKMIDINNGRLKEIHQADLKPFSKLTCLELYENDIEFLEKGLFDYNPNLEMIWLSSNKIVHIDENLFNNLSKLRYLSLDANRCIAEFAENNTEKVKEIIKYSKENCKDMIYLRKLFPDFMKKIDKMQDDINNLHIDLRVQDELQLDYQTRKHPYINSDNHYIQDILLIFFCGTLIGILGALVYKKFFSNNSSHNERVAFENHDYSTNHI